MSETSTLIPCTAKITRAELANVPTPPATATHVPISHLAVVEGLVETLSRRHIGVVSEEFAVSKDGMEMFGVIDLETSFDGCRFRSATRARCRYQSFCVAVYGSLGSRFDHPNVFQLELSY
jgi:hypothetical protein